MRLFLRILGIGLILALVYALFVGLGLTRIFKPHKQLKKIQVLNDFEYPDTDLDWTTGGYVTLDSSTENQTHGKRSLEASYLIPSEFMTMPTPLPTAVPAPVAAPKPSAKNKKKALAASAPTPTPEEDLEPIATPVNWLPTITLSTDSVTKIPLYDWTGFTTLNIDAFNPQDKPVTYHLAVADGRSFQYETSGELTPKKVTNVSVNLSDLLQARLDLSAIRSLSLSVDTQGNSLPVQVYWDYLRLEEVLQPTVKK